MAKKLKDKLQKFSTTVTHGSQPWTVLVRGLPAMLSARVAQALLPVAFLIVLAGVPVPLAAQTRTTVADTIHAPDGSLPAGQIVISATSTFTAGDGTVVFRGTVATAEVTNGAFSVALVPNAGSVPSGTSYQAMYKLNGVPLRSETWVVPQSAAPVDLSAVRSAALSGPSEMIAASQLPSTLNASAIQDKGGQVYNVLAYGAVRDGESVSDAAMASGSAVLTSAGGPFSASDAGKIITVVGAGASGGYLRTTIASYQSATQVTLATAASTTVTGGQAFWGTDNTTAFQNAIDAAAVRGGTVFSPPGFYATQELTLKSGVTIAGSQPQVEYVAGQAPDLDMVPKGGTWIDCDGAQCFSGSDLRGVGLSNVGFEDFSNVWVSGGDSVDGASFVQVRNVYAVGNAQVNSSDTVFRIYNFQHWRVDSLNAFHVNTLLDLIAQTNAWGPGNSTFTDLYAYTYSKTAANGNDAKPGIWLQSLNPTGGNGQPLQVMEFTRPQINSYNSDASANTAGIELSSDGTGNDFVGRVTISGADVEGELNCAISLVKSSNNFIDIASGSLSTYGVCLDNTSSVNVIVSEDNSLTAYNQDGDQSEWLGSWAGFAPAGTPNQLAGFYRLGTLGQYQVTTRNITGWDSSGTWKMWYGAPTGACHTGSLYTDLNGTAGATLYVCEAGAWAAK